MAARRRSSRQAPAATHQDHKSPRSPRSTSRRRPRDRGGEGGRGGGVRGSGFDDIVVAYPVHGEEKWGRVAALAETIRITVNADTEDALRRTERRCGDARGSCVGIQIESIGFPPRRCPAGDRPHRGARAARAGSQGLDWTASPPIAGSSSKAPTRCRSTSRAGRGPRGRRRRRGAASAACGDREVMPAARSAGWAWLIRRG